MEGALALALWVVIWVAVLVLVGWAARYIIINFLPADFHMPALLIVGVILLIVLLMWLVSRAPSRLP